MGAPRLFEQASPSETTALGKILQADREVGVEAPAQHRAGCCAVKWQVLK